MSALINQRKRQSKLRSFFQGCAVLVGILSSIGLALTLWQRSLWVERAASLDYRKLHEMESASLIFDRHGELLGRIFVQNRDQKPLSEISVNLQKAVVSAEDARFRLHHGVDYYGIARALSRNMQAGKTRQGASTLTQQLARNSFPDALPSDDRSFRRKFLEMFVAFEIENRLKKEEILELYLNRVYFGSGFYGAEAAAQGYFGKKAADLTISEAALLAGLLRSPNHLSPWRNRRAGMDSRNHVLSRMRELNAISQPQYDEALANEPEVKNRRPVLMENYATDMVASQMSKLVGQEESSSEGYRIYTTVDLNLQRRAEAALKKQLEAIEQRPEFKTRQSFETFDSLYRAWRKRITAGQDEPAPRPEYLQGAIVILDNHTGAIRAIVGGRDARHSEFNRVTQARRAPGSAFKPFVFATAFEMGLHPFFPIQDAVMDNRKVMVGGTSGILGEWAREQTNTPYEGVIEARKALIKSKNAATVRLGMLLGDDLRDSVEHVAALSAAAGIQSPLRAYPASFIGSSELTLMELALAYTTFPGLGSRPSKSILIDRIEDNTGKVVFREDSNRQKVMSSGSAFQVHECLAAVLDEGTGTAAFSGQGLRRLPFGGKTGSTYDFADAWFVGYSSELTCGVWTGFDKTRMPIFFGAFGSEIAMPVWTDIMNATIEAYPPQPIARPEDLHKCKICGKSGYGLVPNCKELNAAGEPITTESEVWLTAVQTPGLADTCDVHGPKRPRAKKTPDGAGPVKVELAFDLSSITTVVLQSPTVLGDDPYRSTESERTARAIRNFKESGQAAPLNNKIPLEANPEPDASEVPRVQLLTPSQAQPQKQNLPVNPALPKLEF